MSKFLYSALGKIWIFFFIIKVSYQNFYILSRINSGNWQTLKFPYFAVRKIWNLSYDKLQASKSLY